MVEIRPVPADDPVAQELLSEYIAMRIATFPEGQRYQPSLMDPSVFLAPSGVFLVVFDEGGNAVGCGGVRRLADDPSGVTRFEIKHLYLRPDARGQGWGRELFERLEQCASNWGADQIVLDTHHALEVAGNLYASSGFTLIPRYNDNPNATRWYGKTVSGGDA